jgi:hypothetical protein
MENLINVYVYCLFMTSHTGVRENNKMKTSIDPPEREREREREREKERNREKNNESFFY